MSKVVSIDEFPFLSAFGNDDDQREYYLDLTSGDVQVVADENITTGDVDAVFELAWVDNNPDRYLRIPTYASVRGGLLRDFIESEWTDDPRTKLAVKNACHAHNGEISGWRHDSAVAESTYFAFQEFEREHLKAEAEFFLQECGIAAEWR